MPPTVSQEIIAPQTRDDVRFGGYGMDEIAQAISLQESSGGTDVGPRYEPGFEQRYLRGKPQWESLAKQYGWKAVSSSYGPHQIMYPVAVELGYEGSPKDLADPVVNRLFFEKKWMRDWERTGGDFDKTLLRYNGGGDKSYAKKIRMNLESLMKKVKSNGRGR